MVKRSSYSIINPVYQLSKINTMKTTIVTKESVFTCSQCGITKPAFTNSCSNYGIDKAGVKTCSQCIGIDEAKELETAQPGFKTLMYLSGGTVQNWPGTLTIKPSYITKGKHNIAGIRQDVWFTFKGNNFHGAQYGYNSEILHVRRIKNT